MAGQVISRRNAVLATFVERYGDCEVSSCYSLIEQVGRELGSNYLSVVVELSPRKSDYEFQKEIDDTFVNQVQPKEYNRRFNVALAILGKENEVKWKDLLVALNRLQYWTLLDDLFVSEERWKRMLHKEMKRSSFELSDSGFASSNSLTPSP